MNDKIFTYSHSTKSLVQKPGMEKPNESESIAYADSKSYGEESYKYLLKQYNQHIASLKSYPCNWLDQDSDGKEFELGKDFKIDKGSFSRIDINSDGYENTNNGSWEIAIPIPKEQVEEQPKVYNNDPNVMRRLAMLERDLEYLYKHLKVEY